MQKFRSNEKWGCTILFIYLFFKADLHDTRFHLIQLVKNIVSSKLMGLVALRGVTSKC